MNHLNARHLGIALIAALFAVACAPSSPRGGERSASTPASDPPAKTTSPEPTREAPPLSELLTSLARAFQGSDQPLACLPWIDARQRVVVADARTPISETPERPDLRVFPADTARVYFALSSSASPALSETLWEADCASGAVTRAHVVEGADFYHAASARGALVISADGALARFLPGTGEVASLGLPATPTLCEGARDRVLGVMADGTALRLAREGDCGEGGARIGLELRLDLRTGALTRPHPILALERASDGALYASEGGRCDQPGLLDPGHEGALHVSRDQGRSFERVRIPGVATPIAEVVTASDRPERLLVRASMCVRGGAPVGGGVWSSRDGGVSWSALSLPQGLSSAVAVELDPAGAQLTLWAGEAWQRQMWTSVDGGVTWSRAERALPTPRRPGAVRGRGGVMYHKSADGLWRYVGAESTRILPGADGV